MSTEMHHAPGFPARPAKFVRALAMAVVAAGFFAGCSPKADNAEKPAVGNVTLDTGAAPQHPHLHS